MYWKRHAPYVSKEEVQRSFEKRLPYDKHIFVKQVLTAIPEGAEPKQWLYVYDAEGEIRKIFEDFRQLQCFINDHQVTVHALH